MPKIILAGAQIRAARTTAVKNDNNPDYREFSLLVSQDGIVYDITIVENEEVKEAKANNPHFFKGSFGNMTSVMYPGIKACYDVKLTEETEIEIDDEKKTYPKGSQVVYKSIKDANPFAVLEPSAGGILKKRVKSEVLVGKLNEQSRRQKLKVYWNSKTAKVQASGSDTRGVYYTVAMCRTGVAKGPKLK